MTVPDVVSALGTGLGRARRSLRSALGRATHEPIADGGRDAELEALRRRVDALESRLDSHGHVQHVRAREWDAPPTVQDAYCGVQFQRPDGSLLAELVGDCNHEHVELYTSEDAAGKRVKRFSIDSDTPDTVWQHDTERTHKEVYRVKDGGRFVRWFVWPNGKVRVAEEVDPDAGTYRLFDPQTDEEFVRHDVGD